MNKKKSEKSNEILKGRSAPSRHDFYEYSTSHNEFIKNLADSFSSEDWDEILKKRDDFFLRFQHLYTDFILFRRAEILQNSLSKKYSKRGAVDVALISSGAALAAYVTSNPAWAALCCLNVPMILHRINQYRNENTIARIGIENKASLLTSSFRSLEKLTPSLANSSSFSQRILQLALVKFYFLNPVESLKIFDTLNVYGVKDEEGLIRIWGFNPKKNLAYFSNIFDYNYPSRQEIGEVLDEIFRKKFLILAAKTYSIANFEMGIRLHFKKNYIAFAPAYYWDFCQYTSSDSIEGAYKADLGENSDEGSFAHREIEDWYVYRSLYD